MAPFDPLGIALDARRLTHAPAELLTQRQRERLADLVAFARAHSRFYASKYRHLPEIVTDPRQLPPVTKPELMEHFDEVVTDPAIHRADLEAYVANPANIGRPYLGRYMVWTTSGTTGVPGLFLQDHGWDAVLTAVNVARIGAEWYTPDVLWEIRNPNYGHLCAAPSNFGAHVSCRPAEFQNCAGA